MPYPAHVHSQKAVRTGPGSRWCRLGASRSLKLEKPVARVLLAPQQCLSPSSNTLPPLPATHHHSRQWRPRPGLREESYERGKESTCRALSWREEWGRSPTSSHQQRQCSRPFISFLPVVSLNRIVLCVAASWAGNLNNEACSDSPSAVHVRFVPP